ncbi:hypothetical protein HPP92_022941 [Vanilla planifolia]|uniref:Chaperone DnaJ C-terminal domain-containing protein n=1 Tax=Vanilla planifolia TaxID=51239 RepID=A0A835PZ87_VANPL|nr:hypothetical protein HPP92_022941 [Vanilla planifolia]
MWRNRRVLHPLRYVRRRWTGEEKQEDKFEGSCGVDSGSRLRSVLRVMPGEEEAHRRSLCFIEVLSDPVLKRDGNNILYTCKVSYIDAILGTTIKVPTVDATVDLKIPAGTQPGTTLVMAKRGFLSWEAKYKGRPVGQGAGGDSQEVEH